MPNPFSFIGEIEEMNQILLGKLDEVIKRLDLLIDAVKDNRVDFYGDGK